MALSHPSLAAIAAQVSLVAAGLALPPLLPPLHGAMLAVPLTGGSVAESVDVALANGATIEGRGTFAGTIVIRGDRDRLTGPLRAHGIFLVAAASALCA